MADGIIINNKNETPDFYEEIIYTVSFVQKFHDRQAP